MKDKGIEDIINILVSSFFEDIEMMVLKKGAFSKMVVLIQNGNNNEINNLEKNYLSLKGNKYIKKIKKGYLVNKKMPFDELLKKVKNELRNKEAMIIKDPWNYLIGVENKDKFNGLKVYKINFMEFKRRYQKNEKY